MGCSSLKTNSLFFVAIEGTLIEAILSLDIKVGPGIFSRIKLELVLEILVTV